MSTRQAEDVLKHTFKQLEQMLNDVRRQKTVSSRPNKPAPKDNPPQECHGRPGNRASDGGR